MSDFLSGFCLATNIMQEVFIFIIPKFFKILGWSFAWLLLSIFLMVILKALVFLITKLFFKNKYDN